MKAEDRDAFRRGETVPLGGDSGATVRRIMPTTRYRVTFVETTRYVVEFDSPVKLDEDGNTLPYDDQNTEHDWFTTMDAAREDWPMTAEQIDVDERELESVEEITR